MKDLNKITHVYTHAGVFHADDVFAAALLSEICPNAILNRVFEAPEDSENIIVFDIGKGEYDHHQTNRALRPESDGLVYNAERRLVQIPYSSFGLLWRDYGRLLCPTERAWKKVDRDLVLPIDKSDNGFGHNTLATAIGAFNPNWDEEDAFPDSEFRYYAYCIAFSILMAFVRKANSEVAAEQIVLESKVIDDKILVLKDYVPWSEVVITSMPNILYVVFPSNRGGYNVQVVPVDVGTKVPRKGFPPEWLGKTDASLGITFCHIGNFLLSCGTQEQAINCARIAAQRETTA